MKFRTLFIALGYFTLNLASAGDIQHQFQKALLDNDIKTIETLIKDGFSPNLRLSDGFMWRNDTALMVAASIGQNKEAFEILLNHPEADLTVRNNYGETILHKMLYNQEKFKAFIDLAKQKLSKKDFVRLLCQRATAEFYYSLFYIWDHIGTHYYDMYNIINKEAHQENHKLLWSIIMDPNYLKLFIENGFIPSKKPKRNCLQKVFNLEEIELLNKTYTQILDEQHSQPTLTDKHLDLDMPTDLKKIIIKYLKKPLDSEYIKELEIALTNLKLDFSL